MNTKPCQICQGPIEITKHNHTKIYCGSKECKAVVDHNKHERRKNGPPIETFYCSECGQDVGFKGVGRPKKRCETCIINSKPIKESLCRYCKGPIEYVRNKKVICTSLECEFQARKEYRTRYRNKDIDATRAKDRESRSKRYHANPEFYREKQRAYYRGEARQAYVRSYHPDWNKRTYRTCRDLVLDHYGWKCNCCPDAQVLHRDFLTIDHVNNDGNKDRLVRSSLSLLRFIIDNNFPPEYQLLCWNCNGAKGISGMCPHQTKKE